jgi:ribosome-associated translation inhibitor RaiA
MAGRKKNDEQRSTVRLTLRARSVAVSEATRAHVRKRIERALGKYGPRVERATVRFEDVNGPRGGVDTTCRIKVVVGHLPSVLVEHRASSARGAFDLAAAAIERAVRRALGRADLSGSRKKKKTPRSRAPSPAQGAGSLVGRRVGRSAKQIALAAARPEKQRRDARVDTALPGVSASDRRVGAHATARRNTKLDTTGMSATLEDSATGDPSRKSTRRSANRGTQDSNLRRREVRRTRSPSARASRAAAERASGRRRG